MRSPSRLAVRLAAPLLTLVGLGCTQQPGATPAPAPEPPAPGQPPSAPTVVFPELGPPQRLERGVDFHQATIDRGGRPMRVWVYVPEHAAGQKLPCVLVAPAGSPLVVGMELGEGDRPEHLPYARAGFVVVSYEIDGHLADRNAGEAAVVAAATAFKDAGAGVVNARTALDFALAKVPQIDPARVFAAGHSSAATLALLVAAADPRVRGCAAFAPVTDVEARIGRRAIGEMAGAIPGYEAFMKSSSPRSHLAELKCPVFLFHAADDKNVPVGQTAGFAADLKRTNPRVTFVEVPRGGHYDPMIREGIPRAIEWFRTLRAE